MSVAAGAATEPEETAPHPKFALRYFKKDVDARVIYAKTRFAL